MLNVVFFVCAKKKSLSIDSQHSRCIERFEILCLKIFFRAFFSYWVGFDSRKLCVFSINHFAFLRWVIFRIRQVMMEKKTGKKSHGKVSNGPKKQQRWRFACLPHWICWCIWHASKQMKVEIIFFRKVHSHIHIIARRRIKNN